MEAVFTAALEKRDHPFVKLPNGSVVKSSTVGILPSCRCWGADGEGVDPKPVYLPP